MASKNPRINITLDPETLEILETLAKKSSKSVSMQAYDFIRQAIELHEDFVLSQLANEREEEREGKSLISHEDFWK